MGAPLSSHLTTLLGLFSANVALSDEVPAYLEGFSASEKHILREEFATRLQLHTLGMKQFRRSTACEAKDEATAQRFFHDVFRYAFEEGEEPYMPDYTAHKAHLGSPIKPGRHV